MTVGIVGAGQLGRMLALAGYPLGLDFLCLDPAADAPAGQVAPLLNGAFTDRALLRELARRCEVVTFDWENVPVESLRAMQRSPHAARIAPPAAALACGQDRVTEKQLFERLGIPTTRWRAVDSHTDLVAALAAVGLPGVLKTRRLGYDGKGQAVVRTRAEAERALVRLGAAPLLYEEWVPFDCEVSVIGARGARGQTAIYPLCGNVHRAGILRITCAPFGRRRWQALAARYLKRVLAHFRYRGILTIEFFVRGDRLIANEMAPRVHNSGHWTIEGAATSQFENHLRAILGLPLGSTRALGHSAMINLIGRIPPRRQLLALPGLHLHDYGKRPRPGRKVGHVTIVEHSAARRDARARRLAAKLAAGARIP
ncbi:MAG TPA: 5-(carboxyamino)imidazole ribonucleotide synthase [Steroidobacteraceae bacterium]|nr:5-(carboxyamino)imidazole ribonucleotide synthase [Steroidobacteraceae bacterium]